MNGIPVLSILGGVVAMLFGLIVLEYNNIVKRIATLEQDSKALQSEAVKKKDLDKILTELKEDIKDINSFLRRITSISLKDEA